MTDHHEEHNQDDQENHDDCQDCKRQRAQNQKLIEMYQKLQQVDKRTADMKGSIVSHQSQVENNVQTLKKFDQTVAKAKDVKQEKDSSQFQQIGFKLYADMIEKQIKSDTQKENQRLKLILKNIYQQREMETRQNPPSFREKQKSFMETSLFLPQLNKNSQSTAAQWFQKGKQSTSRSRSRKSQSFVDTSMGKSFEISSTKSSFNMTKRKTFEKKDFGQLNLWLFDRRNEILEKDLYEKPTELNDQIPKLKQLSKKKGVTRYINNAKNATRIDMSTVLRKSKNKGQTLSPIIREHALIQNGRLSDSQTKKVLNLDLMKSVLPEHASQSYRFHSSKSKKESMLPSISSK